MKKKLTNKISEKKVPIPDFKNIEEEAEFWDTHSVAPYWHDWKPVKVVVAKNLSSGLTIRFDPGILEKIRSQAQKIGLGPTTLIRMWVMEKLQGTKSPGIRFAV